MSYSRETRSESRFLVRDSLLGELELPSDDGLKAIKEGEEVTPSTLEIFLKSCISTLNTRCRCLAKVEEAIRKTA